MQSQPDTVPEQLGSTGSTTNSGCPDSTDAEQTHSMTDGASLTGPDGINPTDYTHESPVPPQDGRIGDETIHSRDSQAPQYSNNADSLLHVRAVLRCPSTCQCRCHTATTLQAPNYLHKVFGAFFLSYNAPVRFRGRPCNLYSCGNPPSSKVQFHYYLPAWLASCALQFSASWNSLRGKGATLSLKIPRYIETNDSIWHAIAGGHLDYVREKFSKRQCFPTDVDSFGMSLLLVSIRNPY